MQGTGVGGSVGSGSASKEFRLGVLMVHGIGAQPAKYTLVQWGDTLLGVIRDATKNEVRPAAYRASSGDGTASDPAEVQVEMTNGERWLLTEGWWADAFPPPSFFELVTWGFRAIPWTLSVHAAQSYWSTTDAPWYEKWWKRSFVFVWLLAAPVVMLVMLLTMLIGLLPIESVRAVARAVQSTLTTTIGDSLAFVESPTRAAFIRARVIARLEELAKRCDHTIVVAHSQGAAVALDALGGIVHDADPPPERRTYPALDTLVTFGAGINPLASLIVLRDMRTPLRAIAVTPNQTILGLFATLGLLGYIGWSVWAGRLELDGLLEGLALSLVTPLVAFVVIAVIARGRKAMKSHDRSKDSDEPSKLTLAIAVVVLLAAVFGAIAYAEWRHVPFGWLNLGLLVCITFIGGTVALLSRSTRQLVTRVVRVPPGVGRWLDLYASNDPVPNGSVRVAPGGSVQAVSLRVSNRGSMFLDHNAYWQNLDEFVLCVARACATTAKSDWQDLLPVEKSDTGPRAARRVRFRRWASALNLVGWVAVSIALWPLCEPHLPSLFDLLDWHPPGSEGRGPLATYVVLATVVTVATGLAIGLLWRRWVRSEQAQVLAHQTPVDPTSWRFVVMGCVIGCFMPVIQVLLDLGTIETAFQRDPVDTLWSLAMMTFGAGLFIGLILWVAWKFAGLFTWPDSAKPPAPPDALAAERRPDTAAAAIAATGDPADGATSRQSGTKSSGSFPKPKLRADDAAIRKRSGSRAKPSAPKEANEAEEETVSENRASAKKRR